MLMLYFLFKNGKLSSVDPDNLYELALIVANNDLPIGHHLPIIEEALEGFIINLPDSNN